MRSPELLSREIPVPLAQMTFRTVPPMMILVALCTRMPSNKLPRGNTPVASVPMKLPKTALWSADVGEKETPV